ncbi:hypothetical protein [Micromonospora sp. A200]|uniref:hypothetical protein n=1 Tax=Micromonospora sp. A200 TaxID=2940568 RepID=UPI0024749AAF|nr:hypothetical protein [Micromonospora sp. A200]
MCRDPTRTTDRYKIQTGGRTVTTDLCDQDAAPIVELMEKIKKVSPGQKTRGMARVATMEEIEALKKARK